MLDNQIIFGTASIGSRTNYKTFSQTALLASSLGINLFDTAPVYGRGLAVKYLLQFIKENPGLNIKIITKIGRGVKLDLKTLLIYTLRRDFSFLTSGLIIIFKNEFELSTKRLTDTLKYHSQLMQDDKITDLLIHSPKDSPFSTYDINMIQTYLSNTISIGCSDPTEHVYKIFEKKFGSNFIVQVGYNDFINNKFYQRHKGTIIINGMLRESRVGSIKLHELFNKVHDLRKNMDTKYNFGFHSIDTVHEVSRNYKIFCKQQSL